MRRIVFMSMVIGGIGLIVYAISHMGILSLDRIAQYESIIRMYISEKLFIASLLGFLLYTVTVALSIPGASMLTLAYGFFFGSVHAACIVVFGATLGALGIFGATRSVFRPMFIEKVGAKIVPFQRGFEKKPFSYVLLLRIIPLFPFWLINIIPGLLGMKVRAYALATVIGIIPGTFVYTSLGSGLQALTEGDSVRPLDLFLQPKILAAIIGLSLLSVLPIWYRKRGKNVGKEG